MVVVGVWAMRICLAVVISSTNNRIHGDLTTEIATAMAMRLIWARARAMVMKTTTCLPTMEVVMAMAMMSASTVMALQETTC